MGFDNLNKKKKEGNNSTFKTAQKRNYENEKYVPVNIDVDRIKFNPKNKVFNKKDTTKEIENLAASILARGLDNPITVIDQNDGTYLLQAGERRLRAYKLLGKKRIPAKVHLSEGDAWDYLRLLDDNTSRTNLTELEYFNQYHEMAQVLEQLEKNDPENKAISEYRKRVAKEAERFKVLLNNSTDEELEDIIETNDERKLREQKKKAKIRQQIEDQTQKLQESVNTLKSLEGTSYIDEQGAVYYVTLDEKAKSNNERYVIVSDYQGSKDIEIRPELSAGSTFEQVQAKLDNYAKSKGYREIDVDDTAAQQQIQITNLAESKIKTYQKDYDVRKDKADNYNQQQIISSESKVDDQTHKRVTLDRIKNTQSTEMQGDSRTVELYNNNLQWEGRVAYSERRKNEKVRGQLLLKKDNDNNAHLYIIEENSINDITPEDLWVGNISADNEKDGKRARHMVDMIITEVIPSSVKQIKE